MVGSFYDPDLDEGCAFEELISFHGDRRPPDAAVHSTRSASSPGGPDQCAASVHKLLLDWRKHLNGGGD